MSRNSSVAEEIASLRAELSAARLAILEMAPTEASRLLIDYASCASKAEAHRWHERTAERIVELTQPKRASEMGDHPLAGDRVNCPLCGRGSDNILGIEGFAYPEGLQRHLTGAFNARHCIVMNAALGLALDTAMHRAQVESSVGENAKRGAQGVKVRRRQI